MLGYYGKISNQFNLSLIKKRKIREFKDVLTSGSGNPPKFRRLPPGELKNLKERIRKEAAQEYSKEIKKRLILFGVTLVVIWLTLKTLF